MQVEIPGTVPDLETSNINVYNFNVKVVSAISGPNKNNHIHLIFPSDPH